MTDVGLYNGRDLSITDNGDGTITAIVQFSGSGGNTYDADGNRIAHTAGLVRVEFLVDEDFNVIERVGVIKATGTSTDFCTAVVQAIG